MKKERTKACGDNEFLREIIALSPGHLYWKDLNGIILGCNLQQAKALGLDSPDELIGKTEYDFMPKAQADKTREIDRQVMATGKAISAEETVDFPDGRQLVFLSKKVPLLDEGGVLVGILGISLDITARVSAEKREKLALAQVAASEAKAQAEAETRQAVMVLAGSIAHDLRTPLLSLRTMASAIKRIVPPLISEYQGTELDAQYLAKFSCLLDLFEPIVDDMNGSINHSLQALSRVLTNELSDEDLLACDSDKCLHNALDRYPFAEGERELLEWNRDYVFTFRGNPILFTRIISNLVKNSLEQIQQQGKGKIYIRAHDDGDTNLLCIRDTAGGAPPEVVAKLFEGYQTTKQTGTGVGLAFCKLTMQSFGGDISCESVYGDYIEFRLRFPKIHGE